MSLGAMDGATSALLADIVIGFNKFVIVYFALINLGYLSIFLLSLRSLWRFVRRSFFSDGMPWQTTWFTEMQVACW